MANQPQNSLTGANASTSVPQNMRAPLQLNANAMNNQVSKSQTMGVPAAQAVQQAASNPQNKYYAKGGEVTPLPPSAPELKKELAKQPAPNIKPVNASDLQPAQKGDTTEDMFKSYSSPQGQKMESDRAKMMEARAEGQGYAKGGEVNNKGMSLKDIVKMLAQHPDVMGNNAKSVNAPMTGAAMKKGGMPTANTQGKATPSSHGKGLLAMNDDVGTYAQGGSVNSGDTGETDNEVSDNSAGMSDGKAPAGHGILKMADGGNVEDAMQAGSIQGYAPDGTPIITDSSGASEEGNINDFLGRPSNAPTLGTGQDPMNSTSASAANTLGGDNTMTQTMAKGGEEAGPPPGSNSNEVADNIPAKLSEGEFVFSADTTRFYGLRTLNMLQEHARQALAEMNNEGTIRHPGDGKDLTNDKDNGGHFLQDQKPNMNAYSDDGDNGEEDKTGAKAVSGLLAECSGGSVGMATGGGIAEEQSLAKGGSVYRKDEYPIGRDNMVSPHPKGGAVAQDYAVGGLVGDKMKMSKPRPNPNTIPTGEGKIPGLPKLPKFAKGGLVNYNRDILKETTQSHIGA